MGEYPPKIIPYDVFTIMATKEKFFSWFPCCKDCLVQMRCLEITPVVSIKIYNDKSNHHIAVLRPCKRFDRYEKETHKLYIGGKRLTKYRKARRVKSGLDF